MKWIMTIKLCLLLMVCMTDMYAQSPYIHDDSFEYRLGYIYQEENKLSKTELQNVFNSSDYDKYVSGRKLLISGSVLTAVGGAFALVNGALLADHIINLTPDPLHNVDISLLIYAGNTILGGTVMLAGVPCLCVGVNRLKKVANRQNFPELSLTYTMTGANLIFRF